MYLGLFDSFRMLNWGGCTGSGRFLEILFFLRIKSLVYVDLLLFWRFNLVGVMSVFFCISRCKSFITVLKWQVCVYENWNYNFPAVSLLYSAGDFIVNRQIKNPTN